MACVPNNYAPHLAHNNYFFFFLKKVHWETQKLAGSQKVPNPYRFLLVSLTQSQGAGKPLFLPPLPFHSSPLPIFSLLILLLNPLSILLLLSQHPSTSP